VAREDFSIQDRHDGRRHTLVLTGELDIASVPALEGMVNEVCDGGAQQLVLDLRELDFMDSSGLNAILRCRSHCAENLCDLALIPGRRPVQRIFELTHLLDRLPFRHLDRQSGAASPSA
jgi:anti-sigma B factor antagonist